jgi:hypothetical protein
MVLPRFALFDRLSYSSHQLPEKRMNHLGGWTKRIGQMNACGLIATHRLVKLLLVLTLGSLGAWRSGAANSLVYNLNDAGAGSLRQAVSDNNALGGGNTIVFSNAVSGLIKLTSGELLITRAVTIAGPGASVLSVTGTTNSRVFNIANTANANINDLGIVSCTEPIFGPYSGAPGAGLINSGVLSLNRCVVANNAGFPGVYGGALYNVGTAALRDCTFANNGMALYGGAICNGSGSLSLTNCTVFGNSAPYGGGIYNFASLTMISCTVVSNYSASFDSGAVGNDATGTASVGNSVLARSTSPGADIRGTFNSLGYNLVGAAGPTNGFTAVGDQKGTTASPLNPLLGPLQSNGGPTLTLLPLPGSPLLDQGLSLGTSADQRGRLRPWALAGVPKPPGGDASDIGAAEVGPQIVTTLSDSGPGSLRQALAIASGLENGIVFASNVVGTMVLSSGPLVSSQSVNIVGPGAALLAVSGNGVSDTFESLGGSTLISGVTFTGGRVAGASGGFEQDGAAARGGGIFNQSTLSLNNCVISNCIVQGGPGGPTGPGFAGNGGNAQGGGIANIGTLALTNCSLIDNSAVGGTGGTAGGGGFAGSGGQAYGGALYSAGPLTIVRCGLSGNTSAGGTGDGGSGSGSGGALYNDGDVLLFTSTIGSNSAAGSSFDFGGGIFHNGTSLTLRCVTVASNQADYGGGLYVGGAADIGSCILAGNAAPGGGPDCNGSLNSSDFNLVQNTSGATLSGTTTHNITEQSPQLGALGFNGGLGRSFSLATNSPAINHGKSFGAATDQRGAPRPYNWPGVATPSGGDGSDIGAFELVAPPLAIAAAGANVVLSWPSYAAGFSLQSKTNLSAPSGWLAVPDTPAATGNFYYETNSAIGPTRVYRLVSP